MRAAHRTIPLLLLFTLLGRAGAEAAPAAGVQGQVLSESSPLAAAGVYVYNLADFSRQRVQTDAQGKFLFEDLPAGLYKVIAHKAGFVPAVVVVMLTRTAAQSYQTVELQLDKRARGAAGAKDDFWSVRSRIPGDVLRDLDKAEFQMAGLFAPGSADAMSLAGFSTQMEAMTGVDQISDVEGQVSGGGLDIRGNLGSVQVGLQGKFWSLSGDPGPRPGGPAAGGQMSSLSLDLQAGDASRISVMSLNNRLTRGNDSTAEPVGFEHYQVNWSQGLGENGRTDVAAQYTAESNFHRQGSIDPLEIPEASRTWRIEGAYTADLGDRNTLQAGLRYRERQLGVGGGAASLRSEELTGASTLDLFGHGGLRVQPAILLEYGLYSTVSDGSLSLSPQGGIVLQLGQNWRLESSARQRVYEDVRFLPTFLPTLFAEGDLCEQGSEACYQVSVSHHSGDDDSFVLSATHRKVGETLRLYFSEELFDRLESLYLVRGDELPELRLQMTRKLSPQVLTTLESSLATGGGGTFVAANRRPYENQVKYMVTSLDTQFLSSSTGLFVAFHHLAQELQPLGPSTPNASRAMGPQYELDRVRLMLTQDLGFMLDLASDWAVRLDMELSRGPVSSSASSPRDNEVRRRLMGGIAVKF